MLFWPCAGWRGGFTARAIRIPTRPIVIPAAAAAAHQRPTIRRAPIGSGNRNWPLNQKTRNSPTATGSGPRSVKHFRPVGFSFEHTEQKRNKKKLTHTRTHISILFFFRERERLGSIDGHNILLFFWRVLKGKKKKKKKKSPDYQNQNAEPSISITLFFCRTFIIEAIHSTLC